MSYQVSAISRERRQEIEVRKPIPGMDYAGISRGKQAD